MTSTPNNTHAPEETPSVQTDFDRIFVAQKEAFQQHRTPGAQERIGHLNTLKKVILQHKEEIAEAISQDFGHRSPDESFLAEIFSSAETLHHTARHVKKWMKPSCRMPGKYFLPAKTKVYYQPLGVVGIIVPWNYPLYLAMGPIAYALSAGNRVMVRMSQNSSHLAQLLKKIISEAFAENQLALFTGEEVSGATFTAKPWDHILFTGSTDAGRHIMRAAADHLTPVTLELGGKSPAIIGPDVPMNSAVERIAWGKMLNSGQTCVAPDYVFCPEERVTEFVDCFRNAVIKMYPSLKTNPDFTSVENDQQYAHLQELLADAEAKKAEIIEINPAGENFSDSRKMAPRLLLNLSEDMLVLQKEIFGPLLPVLTYRNLEEAIAYVNARPRPLALYYFDYNRQNAEYVITNTYSGGAAVNETMLHVTQENMPFGGVGQSGMGKYHGREGFLTFSNQRGVLFKPKFNSTKLIYPPYKGWRQRLMRAVFAR